MKVVRTPSVEIAIRSLGGEDRNKVSSWFDHLANWENDPFIRRSAQRLPSSDNDYFLRTTTDIRIFFKLEDDTITILDIARQPTITSSGGLSGL